MNEVVDKWYHISENLSTFLSDGVRELVREKGIASTSDVTLNLFNDPLDIDTNLSSLLLKDGNVKTVFFPSSALTGKLFSSRRLLVASNPT